MIENAELTDIIGRATTGMQITKKDSAKRVVKENEIEHKQEIDENAIDLSD